MITHPWTELYLLVGVVCITIMLHWAIEAEPAYWRRRLPEKLISSVIVVMAWPLFLVIIAIWGGVVAIRKKGKP